MSPTAVSGSVVNLRGRSGDATRRPLSVPGYLAAAFRNCDRAKGSLAHKRNGAANITMGAVFTGTIAYLARYVPGSDETVAQVVGADSGGIAARMSGGTTWAAVTLADAISATPHDMTTTTLNGKLYMAYDSAVDRLHLLTSGGTHRRVGLATPAAPTVANTGIGTYAATARTYQVSYRVKTGTTIDYESERSSAVSFTPSGAGTAARVTKPASISESETHWVVWGAPTTGDTTYKLLSEIVVATTTYDDSTAPASYTGDAPDAAGAHTVPKSYKYVATDGNRLLGFGSFESGGRNARLEFTALLGASGNGNDERIPQTTDQNNYIDIDENDGDFGTGVGGPIFGSMYVFKYRSFHKLTPTGIASQPYKRIRLADIGCIRHHAIATCEDASGQATLNWLSHRGPYRFGVGGLEYLGWDVEDLWDTVNLAASTVVAFSVWHSDLHQWWVWFATGAANEPNTLLVFDPREAWFDSNVQAVRGGWYEFTGSIPNARCAAMLQNTLGATMSRDLKPYIGQNGATNRMWRCDDDVATADAGTAFQAYIETVPRTPHPDRYSETIDPILLADAAGGITIRTTVIADYGLVANVTADVLLTATGSETVVRRKVEGLQQAGVDAVAYRIGDSAAVSNNWTLHELRLHEPAGGDRR